MRGWDHLVDAAGWAGAATAERRAEARTDAAVVPDRLDRRPGRPDDDRRFDMDRLLTSAGAVG